MEKNVEIHETFTCKIFLKQNLCKKIIKFREKPENHEQ